MNLDNQPASISLDLRDYGNRIVDLLNDSEPITISGWPIVFQLDPYGSHWLSIQRDR
jgi:hypothetical protein